MAALFQQNTTDGENVVYYYPELYLAIFYKRSTVFNCNELKIALFTFSNKSIKCRLHKNFIDIGLHLASGAQARKSPTS